MSVIQTERPPKTRTRPEAASSLFAASIVGPALTESLRKLHPRRMARNPVMFVVEVGSVLTMAPTIGLLVLASVTVPSRLP